MGRLHGLWLDWSSVRHSFWNCECSLARFALEGPSTECESKKYFHFNDYFLFLTASCVNYLQLLVKGLRCTPQVDWWQKVLHGCQLSICHLTILCSDSIHNQSKKLLLQTEHDLYVNHNMHKNNKECGVCLFFFLNANTRTEIMPFHRPCAIFHHCTSPCWRFPSLCLQTA